MMDAIIAAPAAEPVCFVIADGVEATRTVLSPRTDLQEQVEVEVASLTTLGLEDLRAVWRNRYGVPPNYALRNCCA